MIGHWLSSFFSWPNGSVWGNTLVMVPGFISHHLLMKRHISRTLAQPADAPKETSTP
jgi:hypothetical protein